MSRKQFPTSSPRRGILSCFQDHSDSEECVEAESEEQETYLPRAISVKQVSNPSLNRLRTFDPYGEGDASDSELPPQGQPSLSRVRTYDHFNSPQDYSLPADFPFGQPAVSNAPTLQTAGASSAVSSQSGTPTTRQTASIPAPSPGTQTIFCASGTQPFPASTMVPQQWVMGPGGMMMAPSPNAAPGTMQVPMMPAGFMQTLMPNVVGQPVQMQPAQGAPVQMMGVSMPAGAMTAGAVPGGTVAAGPIPVGAMQIGLPNGMPAGAVMMVPSNFIGGSGQYMAPQALSVQPAGGAIGSAASPVEVAGARPENRPDQGLPQTISVALEADGVSRVRWTVDARKLKGNDKTIVSPPFEIPSKASGTFKMMINPTSTKLKGGATFRNSIGKGSVQLKCDTVSENILVIRFSIGGMGREEPPRGPLEHNFALNGVCGLPKEFSEWDFTKVVDESSKTFVVCLEIM